MKEHVGFLLVIVIGCSTVLGSLYIDCKHEENMAKLGYIEVKAVGTSDTVWVKP